MSNLYDAYLRSLAILGELFPDVRWPRFRRLKLYVIAMLVVNACLYVLIFSGGRNKVVVSGRQVSTSGPRDVAAAVSTRDLAQHNDPVCDHQGPNVVMDVIRHHGNNITCRNSTNTTTTTSRTVKQAPKGFFERFLDWFRGGSNSSGASWYSSTSLSSSHNYNLVLNQPDACRTNSEDGDNVFLLVFVFTVHANFEKRQAIRVTWGSQKLLRDKRIVTLFILAKSKSAYHQKLVELESRQYGDIIMEDFVDSYQNLTLKTIMAMKWASHYCSDANYVMKTDDDMYVNYDALMTLLSDPQTSKTNFFAGNKFSGNAPIRNPKSKWYVPKKMYPKSRYPAFCSGTGYVMSGDIPGRAYNMSLRTRYLYLEDVFMGICLKKLGVKMTGHSGFHIYNQSYKYCAYKRLITVHGKTTTEMYRIWEDQQTEKTKCPKIKITI